MTTPARDKADHVTRIVTVVLALVGVAVGLYARLFVMEGGTHGFKDWIMSVVFPLGLGAAAGVFVGWVIRRVVLLFVR